MAPLLDTDVCPHCKLEVPAPVPRVCPHCAGSLQKRHLRVGCLSSGPALVLAAAALSIALALLEDRDDPEPSAPADYGRSAAVR